MLIWLHIIFVSFKFQGTGLDPKKVFEAQSDFYRIYQLIQVFTTSSPNFKILCFPEKQQLWFPTTQDIKITSPTNFCLLHERICLSNPGFQRDSQGKHIPSKMPFTGVKLQVRGYSLASHLWAEV